MALWIVYTVKRGGEYGYASYEADDAAGARRMFEKWATEAGSASISVAAELAQAAYDHGLLLTMGGPGMCYMVKDQYKRQQRILWLMEQGIAGAAAEEKAKGPPKIKLVQDFVEEATIRRTDYRSLADKAWAATVAMCGERR